MKDYLSKEIKYTSCIYFLLLIIWCTSFFDELIQLEKSLTVIPSLIETACISEIITLFSFLALSLFGTNLKDKFVGLFFIPKTGCKIFSMIKNESIKDDRFNSKEAKKLYSDIIKKIPKDKKEKRRYENSNWYKIYTKYKTEDTIAVSQKDYLKCRDLFIITIFYLCMYIVSFIVFSDIIHFSGKYLILLLFMLVITNISTHMNMKKFVINVIAIDIGRNTK